MLGCETVDAGIAAQEEQAGAVGGGISVGIDVDWWYRWPSDDFPYIVLYGQSERNTHELFQQRGD